MMQRDVRAAEVTTDALPLAHEASASLRFDDCFVAAYSPNAV
jgi:hypothetical protein